MGMKSRRLILAGGSLGIVVGIAAIVLLGSSERQSTRSSATPRPAPDAASPPDLRATETVPASGLVTLQVIVRDAASRNPVGACRITARGDASQPELVADTDLDGIVRFTGLATGAWMLAADCLGFERATHAITLTGGFQAEELLIKGVAALRGLVTDSAARPVHSVAVCVQYGADSIIRYTDQSGQYEVEGLRASDEQSIVFAHPGFVEQRRSVRLDGKVVLDVSLTRAERMTLAMEFPCLRTVAGPIPVVVSVHSGETILYSGAVSVRSGKAVQQVERTDSTQVTANAFHGSALAATAAGIPEAVGDTVGVYLLFEDATAHTLRFLDERGDSCRRTTIFWRSEVTVGSFETDGDGVTTMIVAPSQHARPTPAQTFWCDRGCACDVVINHNETGETQDVHLTGPAAEILVLFGEEESIRRLAPSIRLEERLLGVLRVPPASGDYVSGLRFRVPPGVYRATWRNGPLTEFEARATIGTTSTIDLASSLRQGELIGRTERGATCVLYAVTPNAPVEAARLRANDDGSFRFAPIQAGEYLVAVEFGRSARATVRVDVPAQSVTDVGFVGTDRAKEIQLRLLRADGTPHANQRVTVHGLPRQHHLLSTDETGSDGVVRFGLTHEARLLVSSVYAFCAVDLTAGRAEYELRLPDRDEGADARLPEELIHSDDVLWITSTRRDQLWFVSLKLKGRGHFSLPRCAGTQYFLVFLPGAGPFPLAGALTNEFSWEPRRVVTVDPARVPSQLVSANLACTAAGPHSLKDFAWSPLRIDVGAARPLNVSVSPGFRYALYLRASGEQLARVIDIPGD